MFVMELNYLETTTKPQILKTKIKTEKYTRHEPPLMQKIL